MENPLNLKSLNHISMMCRSLEKSLDFYQNVLGFFPIRRPRSLNFDGAWLFSYYGIGIHLLQSENPDAMPKISLKINPKDNHISFQCECMRTVEKELKEMKIDYVKGRVEENGIKVDQIFFHDPDGFMIEICNCDNLPVVPILPGLSSDASNSNIRSCGPDPGPLTNFSHTLQYPQQMQIQQAVALQIKQDDNILPVSWEKTSVERMHHTSLINRMSRVQNSLFLYMWHYLNGRCIMHLFY